MKFDGKVSAPSLIEHLAASLHEVDARDISIEGSRITFTGGIFRLVTNWNVLTSFGFCELKVDSQRAEISYRLSYRQFVISTAVSFVLLIAILVIVGLPWSSRLILWSPLIYLLAVFSNVGGGILHFKHFLRRSIARAGAAMKHEELKTIR